MLRSGGKGAGNAKAIANKTSVPSEVRGLAADLAALEKRVSTLDQRVKFLEEELSKTISAK